MAEIRPFAALRFARDPEPRIAPPYDVISDDEQLRLGREPENIVHLTLPTGARGARDYDAAAWTLAEWIRTRVLVRDAHEQLYGLEERIPDGRTRRGFFALLRLADYAERIVLPHERTMAGPVRDRLRLMRSVRANLEPLFFLYEDRDGKLDGVMDEAGRDAPLAEVRGPDGTRLALRGLAAPGAIGAVQSFLADRPVVIADGHHRYETLLRYRDECSERGNTDADAAHQFVLAYLVNAFDPGSQVRAIHRVLRGRVAELEAPLADCGFRSEPVSGAADALLEALARRSAHEHAFVFLRPDAAPALARRPRGERLDVEVLHEELLPRLGGELAFDSRPERVLEAVHSGGASLGILLHPLDAERLFRLVQTGAVLPQKSTFFSPKVPSGLVVRDFA